LVVVAIIQVKRNSLKAEARRRVSYQQQMDMSESFLNYGGNLFINLTWLYIFDWTYRYETIDGCSVDEIIIIHSCSERETGQYSMYPSRNQKFMVLFSSVGASWGSLSFFFSSCQKIGGGGWERFFGSFEKRK
jgi:hypothetical protein